MEPANEYAYQIGNFELNIARRSDALSLEVYGANPDYFYSLSVTNDAITKATQGFKFSSVYHLFTELIDTLNSQTDDISLELSPEAIGLFVTKDRIGKTIRFSLEMERRERGNPLKKIHMDKETAALTTSVLRNLQEELRDLKTLFLENKSRIIKIEDEQRGVSAPLRKAEELEFKPEQRMNTRRNIAIVKKSGGPMFGQPEPTYMGYEEMEKVGKTKRGEREPPALRYDEIKRMETAVGRGRQPVVNKRAAEEEIFPNPQKFEPMALRNRNLPKPIVMEEEYHEEVQEPYVKIEPRGQPQLNLRKKAQPAAKNVIHEDESYPEADYEEPILKPEPPPKKAQPAPKTRNAPQKKATQEDEDYVEPHVKIEPNTTTTKKPAANARSSSSRNARKGEIEQLQAEANSKPETKSQANTRTRQTAKNLNEDDMFPEELDNLKENEEKVDQEVKVDQSKKTAAAKGKNQKKPEEEPIPKDFEDPDKAESHPEEDENDLALDYDQLKKSDILEEEPKATFGKSKKQPKSQVNKADAKKKDDTENSEEEQKPPAFGRAQKQPRNQAASKAAANQKKNEENDFTDEEPNLKLDKPKKPQAKKPPTRRAPSKKETDDNDDEDDGLLDDRSYGSEYNDHGGADDPKDSDYSDPESKNRKKKADAKGKAPSRSGRNAPAPKMSDFSYTLQPNDDDGGESDNYSEEEKKDTKRKPPAKQKKKEEVEEDEEEYDDEPGDFKGKGKPPVKKRNDEDSTHGSLGESDLKFDSKFNRTYFRYQRNDTQISRTCRLPENDMAAFGYTPFNKNAASPQSFDIKLDKMDPNYESLTTNVGIWVDLREPQQPPGSDHVNPEGWYLFCPSNRTMCVNGNTKNLDIDDGLFGKVNDVMKVEVDFQLKIVRWYVNGKEICDTEIDKVHVDEYDIFPVVSLGLSRDTVSINGYFSGN